MSCGHECRWRRQADAVCLSSSGTQLKTPEDVVRYMREYVRRSRTPAFYAMEYDALPQAEIEALRNLPCLQSDCVQPLHGSHSAHMLRASYRAGADTLDAADVTIAMRGLSAHQQPPNCSEQEYKRYQEFGMPAIFGRPINTCCVDDHKPFEAVETAAAPRRRQPAHVAHACGADDSGSGSSSDSDSDSLEAAEAAAQSAVPDALELERRLHLISQVLCFNRYQARCAHLRLYAVTLHVAGDANACRAPAISQHA